MSMRCLPRSERKGKTVAEDIEVRLSRMRRAMARMLEQGREREFAALDKAYQALKREQVEEAARERVAQGRPRRVGVRPVEELRRWRLPRGFGRSPLAAQRAREGRPVVPVVPVGRPALSPWRYGGSMSEVIWRPGR